MESLLGVLAGFAIVIFVLVIGIYVAEAIFLNKFNKLVYGKGTPMAWIPVANVYLLGKLTVNKLVGWILVACVFLTSTVTTTINGVETTHTILPESISSVLSTLYSIAVFGLFIYAIIKYNNLKKEKKNQSQLNNLQNNNFNGNVQQNNINQDIQQPSDNKFVIPNPVQPEQVINPTVQTNNQNIISQPTQQSITQVSDSVEVNQNVEQPVQPITYIQEPIVEPVQNIIQDVAYIEPQQSVTQVSNSVGVNQNVEQMTIGNNQVNIPNSTQTEQNQNPNNGMM